MIVIFPDTYGNQSKGNAVYNSGRVYIITDYCILCRRFAQPALNPLTDKKKAGDWEGCYNADYQKKEEEGRHMV